LKRYASEFCTKLNSFVLTDEAKRHIIKNIEESLLENDVVVVTIFKHRRGDHI